MYELTKSGYWNHIDLRMIWNTTTWENGKYTVICKTYKETFTNPGFGVPRPLDLFDTEPDDITLVIDNTPVEVEILDVQYESGIPIEECGIINLGSSTENLIFHTKAVHPNGYLGGYTLTAHYGKNKNAGTAGSDH